MAIEKVRKGEIVDVDFYFPDKDTTLHHPGVVVSTQELQEDENGMVYILLISSKNIHPKYTIKLTDEMVTKPLGKQSYFVTQFLMYFSKEEINFSYGRAIRQPYLDQVIAKTIDSIFGWEVS
jgi:hypothetical protein